MFVTLLVQLYQCKQRGPLTMNHCVQKEQQAVWLLPLIRSEASVSDWVEMNLFPVYFIQLNGKTREAVIHVGVGRQWPCNHTQYPCHNFKQI